MKKYWPLMGAAGIVATLGLYRYVSRDPIYEEQETEEFVEEEMEYEIKLPAEEISRPYNAPKDKQAPKDKEKITPEKTKQNSPINSPINRKETITRHQPYAPSLPKSSDLEDTLEDTSEEDEKEYPSYYIPPEERDSQFPYYRAEKYFDEALEAKDYKIAEMYIDDILSVSDNQKKTKRALLCEMVVDYLNYCISVKKNCETQDPYSVLLKVLSMNAILNKYEEDISCKVFEVLDIINDNVSGNVRILEADEVRSEGEKSLQKVIQCHE